MKEGAVPQDISPNRIVRQAQVAAAAPAENHWVRSAARLGYAAIGVVYVLVGVLAVQVALGSGRGTPDKDVALHELLQAPFGRVLLGIVAVGLFGYLIWRMIEAIGDVEGRGNEAKGLAMRAGYAISGLIYGSLGLQAARLALGQGQGQEPQDWTARLLGQPFGRWMVGAVGLVVLGVGVYQIYKGWSDLFREKLAMGRMGEAVRRWATWAARLGLSAHGIVLGMIGWFLIRAAVTFNPDEARGLGGALASLASQSYGPWLLAAVAVGLAAYGVYNLVVARYHHLLAR
jgi:hypothetical protein